MRCLSLEGTVRFGSIARTARLAVVAAPLALGCKSNPVEPPSLENFARAWTLTKCEYQAKTGGQRVDLVAQGWQITLNVSDNGLFFYSTTPPGGSTQTIQGTWSISGEIVTLRPATATVEWQFTAKVRETSMTLDGANGEWDVNGDGTPDPVTWNMAGRTEP